MHSRHEVSQRLIRAIAACLATVMLVACHGAPGLPVMLASSGTSGQGTPLIRAAHDGDIARATALLDSGADIDAQDGNFHSPLMVAVSEGQRAMVEFLLARGAAINLPLCRTCMGMNGATPQATICLLCLAHDARMVDLLLAHGADVRAWEGFPARATALHVAVMQRDLGLAERYLALGADIDSTRASGGDSPLHLAVERDDIAMTRMLFRHGASPGVVDQNGRTVMFRSRSPQMVGLLLQEGVDPSRPDRHKLTALAYRRDLRRRLEACDRTLESCVNGQRESDAVIAALLEQAALPTAPP